MRYTLRQLEVFLATARHENVTRAAQALAMSQSAASGALSELENQFDIKLFDRLGKRLQLVFLEAKTSCHSVAAKLSDHTRITASHSIQRIANVKALNRSGRALDFAVVSFARIGEGDDRSVEFLLHPRGKNTDHTLMPTRIIDA